MLLPPMPPPPLPLLVDDPECKVSALLGAGGPDADVPTLRALALMAAGIVGMGAAFSIGRRIPVPGGGASAAASAGCSADCCAATLSSPPPSDEEESYPANRSMVVVARYYVVTYLLE